MTARRTASIILRAIQKDTVSAQTVQQEASVGMATITMRAQRRRLVNAALDAHAGWREQCSAVEVAYRRWEAAQGHEGEAWYIAYSVALDREERAARRYASLLQRVGNFAATDLEPMKGRPAAAGSW
jgi:hypothetical protein